MDDFITSPEEREQKKRDREQRRKDLEAKSEKRAKDRADRKDRERREDEQNDAYNRREGLGELGALTVADTSGEMAGGKPNSRGTFSAFAARALGAGTYQEKMLKANKDTAKNTADIAVNTRQPNIAQFQA